MYSNCSGERLFSKLNLIKNHLRSIMKDDTTVFKSNLESFFAGIIEK